MCYHTGVPGQVDPSTMAAVMAAMNLDQSAVSPSSSFNSSFNTTSSLDSSFSSPGLVTGIGMDGLSPGRLRSAELGSQFIVVNSKWSVLQ